MTWRIKRVCRIIFLIIDQSRYSGKNAKELFWDRWVDKICQYSADFRNERRAKRVEVKAGERTRQFPRPTKMSSANGGR